jgi:hypothetical protein
VSEEGSCQIMVVSIVGVTVTELRNRIKTQKVAIQKIFESLENLEIIKKRNQ